MNPYVRIVITGQLDIVQDNVRTYTVKQGSCASESGLNTDFYWRAMLGVPVILWRVVKETSRYESLN